MSKYQLIVQKKPLVCITKESNIKCLLNIVNKNNNSTNYDCTDIYYREQQINLAYSLLTNEILNSEVILKKILKNMTNYENLIESEKNFLSYLWMKNIGMY